jgi:hypothetical protein
MMGVQMLTCRVSILAAMAAALAFLAPGLILAARAQTVSAAEVAPSVGVQLTFRGEWSPSVIYARDDLVTARGSTWRAKRTNKGKVPGSTSPSTAAHWEVVAAGLNPLGAWTASARYHGNDVVTHLGAVWRAIRTSRNRVPGLAALDWEPFASKGDRGQRGAKGATGPKGDKGDLGDPGATGPQGAQGAPGATGPQGPQGEQGATGATGAQGPQGAAGAQGAKGLNWRGAWSSATAYLADDAVQFAGKAYLALQGGTDKDPASETAFWSLLVSGVNWRGTWINSTGYVVNDAVFREGSSYVAIADNTGMAPESEPSFWSPMAQKGDTGDTGAAGPAGATGAIGPAGATGAIGPAGATGATGPAGADGAVGAQGPQGPAGDVNSVADGSVGAPTINFTSSPSTGIFSPATGKIAMAAGGALFLHNIGTENTALGSSALVSNTTGDRNTALGSNALQNNTTGGSNTALGRSALFDNTTGGLNTAVGDNALQNNTTGSYNTAAGFYALTSNTAGNSNTALGFHALSNNNLGINNTALGLNALFTNTTGNNNIAVGYAAGSNANNASNSIFIGNIGSAADITTIKIGTQGTQTKALIAGIRGVQTGAGDGIAVLIDSNGQLGTTNSSRRYKDDIQPMGDVSATLTKLRPVTFRYKKPYADGAKPMQYGLIAEEVAEVLPDLAVFNADGQPETVKYHLLPSFLLAAYQEQHKTIRALTSLVAVQERRLRSLEAQLARLGAVPAASQAAALGQGAEAGARAR